MIEWWWLLVEAAVLCAIFGWAGGSTRAIALLDAYSNPRAARSELLRRWKHDRFPHAEEAFDATARDHAVTGPATALLAALVTAGTLTALAIADTTHRDPRIASTDVAEVCATDGLPGSAYSRKHRTVMRRPVPGHQVDHVVPLCLGGADVEANIRIQPIDEALEKDQLEAHLCRAVCKHRTMPLAEAQAILLGNWKREMWRIGR